MTWRKEGLEDLDPGDRRRVKMVNVVPQRESGEV